MSNIHRPSEHVLVKRSFVLAITAAATNGTGIDTLGYSRALAIFTAAPSGAGTTSDCKLQDSADNSAYADVASATFAQATTAGGTVTGTMNIDLTKRNRYLRLVHTGAGGSAAGQAAGHILLFNPLQAAPAQDVAAVSV
jgi:hypothetical protein